jgi:hypothetical protein
MIVVFFSMNALMLFGKMIDFRTFSKALLQVLNASLGSYNSDIFEANPELRVIGNTFFNAYMIINVLLLTNYVVAVMTDRYAAL